MNTTNAACGADGLIALIDEYAEARHRKGHSTYNAEVFALRQSILSALASTAQQPVVAQAAPVTVEQVEEYIGLSATAWDTIGGLD